MGWRPDHPGSCSVVLAAPFLTLWSSLYPRLDRAAVVVQRLMFLKALMTHSRLPHSVLRSPAMGYAAAVVVPTTLTFISAWLSLPPFIFEHLMVLLVVAVALPWGLTPAVVAALVSVTADNVLLREPIGRPTITGYRDLIDLALYATVAVVVSSLVTRAHTARLAAQDAALLERRAREDRDRLVATVMHDLATPLAVLGGSVRFARARPSSQVDWARLLSRLDTATTRATSLLRLLSDARALDEDRDLGLEIGSHDLRTVVAPIAEMMDRFSERHPVVFSAPEHPVVVTADAERLQQVIENLINNAIKYSPEGGAVEISVTTERDQAILRVRDYGIGISEEAIPHIFDRSFRAPDAARHAPGLGLGLNIAAQVVARHHGAISATAAAGAGTVFTILLPLAAMPAVPRTNDPAHQSAIPSRH
jgi:signal transduction histidine kinase